MTDLIVDNEFRDLIPPLSDDEQKQLEENILRDGIQDPLKVWKGTLIDGHNRYELAKRYGLTFATTELHFDTRDDAIIWIIKNQFGRRNLSAYDRSLLALKLKPVIAAKAKEQQGARTDILENSTKSSPINTRLEIAKASGVSDNTIAKVERIEQQATPEIKQALRTGDLSINAAYNKVKQAERAEDIQRQIDELEQKAIEKPDGLFDVIVIDPPWNYGTKLLAEAYRAANPYPEMTQAELKAIELPAAELNYQWCLCYLTPGQKTQIWGRHIQAIWKPLLWFVKGNHAGDWLGVDVVTSDARDKNFHEWGQSLSGMKGIIERFTDPDDVILDPFLGGGTTGVVALSCKRKFIGVDIKQSCIDTSKTRIEEVFDNALTIQEVDSETVTTSGDNTATDSPADETADALIDSELADIFARIGKITDADKLRRIQAHISERLAEIDGKKNKPANTDASR